MADEPLFVTMVNGFTASVSLAMEGAVFFLASPAFLLLNFEAAVG